MISFEKKDDEDDCEKENSDDQVDIPAHMFFQWVWSMNIGGKFIIHIKSCMRWDILKWGGEKSQARGKSWNKLSFIFTIDPVWE